MTWEKYYQETLEYSKKYVIKRKTISNNLRIGIWYRCQLVKYIRCELNCFKFSKLMKIKQFYDNIYDIKFDLIRKRFILMNM